MVKIKKRWAKCIAAVTLALWGVRRTPETAATK